jgi:hypothetical protein
VHLILIDDHESPAAAKTQEWFTPKARAWVLGKILRPILHTAGQDVMNVFT